MRAQNKESEGGVVAGAGACLEGAAEDDDLGVVAAADGSHVLGRRRGLRQGLGGVEIEPLADGRELAAAKHAHEKG